MNSQSSKQQQQQHHHPKSQSKKHLTRVEELKQQQQREIIVPKDVNQFRHMIEKYYIRESDLEWMLRLRSYKQMRKRMPLSSLNPPDFYSDDLSKYRIRTETDKQVNKKYLKTNFAEFKHVMSHRQANNALARYETTLRAVDDVNKNKPAWKTSNLSVKQTLFDTYLPPVLHSSKVNLDKLKEEVSRPFVQVNYKSICGDKQIRQRRFELSPEYTARFPSEHVMTNKYNDRYGIKNLNAIKHIMIHDQSNTNTLWEANLRGGYERKVAKSMNK